MHMNRRLWKPRFWILLTVIVWLVVSLQPSSYATDSPSDKEPVPSNLPPHLVIFLSDVAVSHRAATSKLESKATENPPLLISTEGMQFKRAVASSSELATGRQVLETGTVFGIVDSTRTLADHMKLKGYRLMIVGDTISAPGQEGDFRFDVVADSLDIFELQATPIRFQKFLASEIQHDHRPLCLIVRDRNTKPLGPDKAPSTSSLEHTFRAVRDSLPINNTIFIYTAICGEPVRETSDTCDRCLLDVPLTAVWDGHIPAGRTSDALVSTVDILPTLVELIGATPPSEIDGRSFASVLRGESHEHRDVAFSVIDAGKPSERYCVHDSRFMYLSSKSVNASAVALYDLLNDPRAESNLKTDPGYHQRALEMRDQLDLWLQRHGRPSLATKHSD